MTVNISDLESILEILQLNSLFSTKPPRETSTLDPGFTIYRGVAGVNVPAPATFGELKEPNLLQEPWQGPCVSLGGRDCLKQVDGFRPRHVPEGGIMAFPRLWVRIKCSSWSHREKRTSKSTTNHPRHSIAGPFSGDVMPSSGEGVSPGFSLPMASVSEDGRGTATDTRGGYGTPRLGMQAQDDWEIGRKTRSGSAVPNLIDAEKIDHKVTCAVISGHMRHGIRIGQRERCSIYDIEELYGQGQGDEAQTHKACLGGSPTEVEFELQLTVQAPNHCGICRCALAVLPAGAHDRALDGQDPLLKMVFDVSVEEHLHFIIASSHFDSNSSYSVALNWVLCPSRGAPPVTYATTFG